jgi:CBS domain-containing protein
VSQRTRLARDTPVAVCQTLLAIEPLLVHADDDVLVAMRRSAAQPETRLLGVVDSAGTLVGVLPVLRLAEAVVARVAPESLLTEITDLADVERFKAAVEAKVVGDLMALPATIQGHATVDAAFREMHRRHLSALYVVDATGRPTGYLDLLELAVNYVDALEAGTADQTT